MNEAQTTLIHSVLDIKKNYEEPAFSPFSATFSKHSYFFRIIFSPDNVEKDNPLPNDKILDTTKLKAFADDNLNVAKKMISVFDIVQNTSGKGENTGYQHFLLFP